MPIEEGLLREGVERADRVPIVEQDGVFDREEPGADNRPSGIVEAQ